MHQLERAHTAGHEIADRAAAAPDHAHQLAVQCHGDPKKLGTLMATLPATTKREVLIEAQKLYGNSFVQHATKHGVAAKSAGEVSYEKTQALHFYSGGSVVSEQVTLSIKAGEGPVSFAASDGSLTVADQHFHFSLKDGKAITGGLKIPDVTVAKWGTWKSKLKVQGGYVGVELGALYALKGKGWTGTMQVSAFVGFAPTSKFPPDDDPLKIPAPTLQQVIEACELGLLAGIGVAIATGLIVLA